MAKIPKYFDELAVRVAAGEKVADAAGKVGCSLDTAYGISRRPEFKARVAEFRTEATDNAVGALSDLAVKAVQTLELVMDDSEARAADRISAAKAVLASVNEMAQLHELRQRIDALERAQEDAGGDV